MDYGLATREKRYLHDGDPSGLLPLLPGTKTRNRKKQGLLEDKLENQTYLAFYLQEGAATLDHQQK